MFLLLAAAAVVVVVVTPLRVSMVRVVVAAVVKQ
jgi:hypothetical protein